MIEDAAFDALAGVFPVLGRLPELLCVSLRRELSPILPRDGQTAFNYGDSCSGFVFLVCGGIRVTRAIEQGRELLLYTVNPGDSCILTVSSILGDRPYPARGVWEGRAMGYAISRAFFLRLMDESEEFRAFIFRTFSERISHLMELVDEVVWKPVSARLASHLLEREKDGIVLVTHQALANDLGTVREVVSRCLGEMSRRGLIRVNRMRIEILDQDRLNRFASGEGFSSPEADARRSL